MKKFITLLLVLTGMVTTAMAATSTTVYCAVSTSYTVKLHVKTSNEYNPTYEMSKTKYTYNGVPIYSYTYTDEYDGVDFMKFELWDGSTLQEDKTPYSTWTTVGTYNYKLFLYASNGWATYEPDCLKGSWDSFADPIYFEDGEVTKDFTAGTSTSFKIVLGGTWYGATATGYNFDWTVSSTTAFSNDGGARNFMLFAHLPGTYTFSLTISDGAPTNLSISSPSGSYEKTTVYFCNTLSWATPYFYIRTNAYYDDTYGSGSNQCPNGMAMSKIGETNIWKAEFPTVFLDADIAFLDRKQDSYDNFYNAKASVRGDFSTSKPLFVPNTTSNDTKNGTTYYSNGEWHAYPTYTRSVTENNFGTICVPFAATVTGATVFKIVSTVGSGDGLTGINLESVDALEAGKAYIFKATGTTLTATYSGSYADATDANGMLGTYTATTAPVNSYVLGGNEIHKVTGDAVAVGANRAWITLTDISPVGARGLDFIAFEGSGTTGIETVKANQTQNGEYFNLAGQRVAQPTKGLYIVNGKKVIIK